MMTKHEVSFYRVIQEKDYIRLAWEKDPSDGQYYWRSISENENQKFTIGKALTRINDLKTQERYKDKEGVCFSGDIFLELV